jgi:hypothetical protein
MLQVGSEKLETMDDCNLDKPPPENIWVEKARKEMSHLMCPDIQLVQACEIIAAAADRAARRSAQQAAFPSAHGSFSGIKPEPNWRLPPPPRQSPIASGRESPELVRC